MIPDLFGCVSGKILISSDYSFIYSLYFDVLLNFSKKSMHTHREILQTKMTPDIKRANLNIHPHVYIYFSPGGGGCALAGGAGARA